MGCCGHRCSCWFFCTIFFTIYTLITIMFMTACLVGRNDNLPTSIKFNMTSASLTQFNLTTNHTLYYNFRVNITATSPNSNVVVYYRRITATALYKDNSFASSSFPPFDHGHNHKNNTFLRHVVFEGQSVMKLKSKQLAEYAEETRVGIYNDLTVELDFRIRFHEQGKSKSSGFNPPFVECGLRVHLNISNAKSPPSFNVTECASVYFFSDRNTGD